MLLIVFKALLTFSLFISLPVFADEGEKSQLESIQDDLRKRFYTVKGFSEEFYEEWIEPIDFHLKWQVGPSFSVYRSKHRNITYDMQVRAQSQRMNLNFDLLGLYIRHRGKRDLFGINLGVNSDNIESKNREFQADQYIGALSWVSFWEDFRQGLYGRMDLGIIWYDLYRVADSAPDIRESGPGAGAKLGLGHSWNFRKSSMTLELDYANSFVNEAFAHNFSLNLGFLL